MKKEIIAYNGIYIGLGCLLIQILPWLWSLKIFFKFFLRGEQPEFTLFLLIILILIILSIISIFVGYFVSRNLISRIIFSFALIILLHLIIIGIIVNTIYISH
jgi:hypothetical protein